jgi:hypothetical protein
MLFHAFFAVEARVKGPDKYQTIHGWLLSAGKVKD